MTCPVQGANVAVEVCMRCRALRAVTDDGVCVICEGAPAEPRDGTAVGREGLSA